VKKKYKENKKEIGEELVNAENFTSYLIPIILSSFGAPRVLPMSVQCPNFCLSLTAFVCDLSLSLFFLSLYICGFI
jgi:hypothetical protein